MHPMIPEDEERDYMRAIGVQLYHRSTDKYNICASDLEDPARPNESTTNGTSHGTKQWQKPWQKAQGIDLKCCSIEVSSGVEKMKKSDMSEIR